MAGVTRRSGHEPGSGATVEAMEGRGETWTVVLEELGEGLAKLRLCTPEQQRKMERSLAQVGQLAPVLARSIEGQLELVDGFKRLRAARVLGWTKLRVEVSEGTAEDAKLWMVQSNGGRGLSEIEEAWVVRALHREDGLTQPQIAALFGRHKSWVCRRLILVEGLSDQLQADLRLGLLAATAARELARLPRGNQDELARVVMKRGLTTRQVCRLVNAWEAADTDAKRTGILASAREGGSVEPVKKKSRPRTDAEWIVMDILRARERSAKLQGRLLGGPLTRFGADAAQHVREQLAGLDPVLAALRGTIERVLGTGAKRP